MVAFGAARRLPYRVPKAGRTLRLNSNLREPISMSSILEEPPVDPIRSYFSQLCVLLTGIASGVVEPLATEDFRTPAFQMGRRDGYHVVVAHLASSRSLKEASDKCLAFGRGVEERAEDHPYGPEWCYGFAKATLDAVDDIAMYAATETMPSVDKIRLRTARSAARRISPLSGVWPVRQSLSEPPRSHHEW